MSWFIFGLISGFVFGLIIGVYVQTKLCEKEFKQLQEKVK